VSSGRPDFHPTMLLEGKHDTQLIPVLVDANGQMYIVMTGQEIEVNNLPDDYFKSGENVGGIDSNVTVDQSAKDRDMIGIDGTSRRQVAVDSYGIMLARMKGAYGGALKDIAVDDTGIMLARLKGVFGDALKDIKVDVDGQMIAVIKGSDGTVNRTLKVDTAGNLLARIMGYDGSTLKDVRVDSDGYMQAKMLGLYDSTLKTIAVDAAGIMKANLSAQDLAYLKVRPTYGPLRAINYQQTVCAGNAWTTLATITGMGVLLGGHLEVPGNSLSAASLLKLKTDNTYDADLPFWLAYQYPMFARGYMPLYCLSWIDSSNFSNYGLTGPIPFDSKLEIQYYNVYATQKVIYSFFTYALVP
jgi:hypothetical protein